MNINRLKNMSIILMAFFAIFQTAQLWFENISNRNFFYTLFSSTASNESEYIRVRPSRVITNLGNRMFTIASSDLNNVEVYKLCDYIIERLIAEGEFVESRELNRLELLVSPSYIMEYGTAMPNEIFTRGYGAKNANVTSKLRNKVDNVTIIPDAKGVRIVFVENENHIQHEFLLRDDGLNDEILHDIAQAKLQLSDLYYISSLQNDLSAFTDNVFIPRWSGSGYNYIPLYSENPYVPSEKHIKIIEKNIMYFFENPSGIWSNKVNGVYTYSDKNKVVKYYNNDVLEYNDFTATKDDIARNFMQDYSTAVRFLNNDIHLLNEFYLADYEIGEYDTTFFFNYTINNLPIYFSSESRDETNMNYPIEITVDNSHVIHYKRISQIFMSDTTYPAVAGLDFMGSLNSIFPTEEDLAKSDLEDIELAYKIDKNKQILLYWFLNLEGILYVKST